MKEGFNMTICSPYSFSALLPLLFLALLSLTPTEAMTEKFLDPGFRSNSLSHEPALP